MKRLIPFILPVLFAIGCEKSQVINYEFQEQQSQEAIVLQKLNDFVASLSDESPYTKGTNGREVKSIDKISIQSAPETKSMDSNIASEYTAYIVNYSDDQGFGIIGMSDSSQRIIAYSESGNIDPKSLSLSNNEENTFLKQLIINGIVNDDESVETKATTGSVSPLLKTMWTQQTSSAGVEYNKYCYMTKSGNNNNHVPCGCTILAGAMVIAYNGYPTSFTINGRTLSWFNMANYSEPYDDQAKEDVALLIGQLFNDCNGKIAFSEGTMVTARQIELRLKDYGYNNVGRLQGSHFTSNMRSKTETMLEGNRPVFISALGTSNHEGSGIYGHSWVIDGYRYEGSTMLVHCNWGWSGKGNGYFATNCFRTREGVSYDRLSDQNNPSNIPLQNLSYHYRLVYYGANSGTKSINKSFEL